MMNGIDVTHSTLAFFSNPIVVPLPAPHISRSDVWLNGVLLKEGADYSIVSQDHTVELTIAVARIGDQVMVRTTTRNILDVLAALSEQS
jgi:hypothetical protein